MTGPNRLDAIADVLRQVVREEEIFRDPPPFFASPHDIRSERVILVALLEGWATDEDVPGLVPADFYSRFHGFAFAAIQAGAHTPVALLEALVAARVGSPERVASAVADLDDRHTWGPVAEHVERVISTSRRRRIIHNAQRIAAAAAAGDVTVAEAITMMEST